MNDPTFPRFAATLAAHGATLARGPFRVLQLNLGGRCDLACAHCHVSAGPNRVETMSAATADAVLAWIARRRPSVVDLTGGAPELCAEFRRLAEGARAAGAEAIVRTNLVVLLAPEHADLPAFFARLRLRVVASLPCYLEKNVDAQRGTGVFARSIEALRRLNAVGYGAADGPPLDLMYNPGDESLPPDQSALERDYRRELGGRYGVVFSRLLCLANLPVGRFGAALRARGAADAYVRTLAAAFNPAAVPGLMCRDTLSVGYEGDVFDCDFNQMERLPLAGGPRRYLWDLDPATLEGAPVAVGPHCFGCTAGRGSSCGGALV